MGAPTDLAAAAPNDNFGVACQASETEYTGADQLVAPTGEEEYISISEIPAIPSNVSFGVNNL